METEAAPRRKSSRERELGESFVDALGYAARAHDGQLRTSDGQPYIAHLLRTTGLVIQEGGSEDEAIAALLHDAVEDQGGLDRLRDIRGRFGSVVADIVDECTDSYGEPKQHWRKRKEQYLSELEEASPGALLVSVADKLDNVRTMLRGLRSHGDEIWEQSGKNPEDARWYYGTLATVFSRLRPGPLADDLASTVAALDREIASEVPTSSPEHAGAAPRRPG
jgi:(p)ppGpp synthase/HD superfamily hydrolase